MYTFLRSLTNNRQMALTNQRVPKKTNVSRELDTFLGNVLVFSLFFVFVSCDDERKIVFAFNRRRGRGDGATLNYQWRP